MQSLYKNKNHIVIAFVVVLAGITISTTNLVEHKTNGDNSPKSGIPVHDMTVRERMVPGNSPGLIGMPVQDSIFPEILVSPN